MSQQLSLFEQFDLELKATEQKAQQDHRQFMTEIVQCHFCNEKMQRAVMNTNHGIVFNGWCMKALAYHVRNCGVLYSEEARWLQARGISPNVSRFDKSHWDHDNIKNHYELHFGQCYTTCSEPK
jgi:uncharacterized Zn finger protein